MTVDARYQALQSSPVPVDFRGRPFDAFDLRTFLDEVLPGLSLPAHPAALEYGTGTGPGACYLAARGFRVDAIDSSASAIELARRFAAERDLAVRFEVADITDLSGWPARYDLIVDSFCLHNVLSDADRRRTLATVRDLLRPEGYFVVGTSVFEDQRDYGADFRDERTGVVYSPLPEDSIGYSDAVEVDGAWFYEKVRHVPPAQLRAELEAAGFCVLEQQGGRVLCAPEEVAS